MSYETEDKIIVQYFESNWDTTVADIVWDNIPYTPGAKPFLVFRIVPASAEQVTISQYAVHRHIGNVFVTIYGKLNTGTRALMAIADSIADIFRATQVQNIVFKTPSVERIGESEGFFSFGISIPYYRDENYADQQPN